LQTATLLPTLRKSMIVPLHALASLLTSLFMSNKFFGFFAGGRIIGCEYPSRSQKTEPPRSKDRLRVGKVFWELKINIQRVSLRPGLSKPASCQLCDKLN
jgi:hypothetical protein